MMLGETKYNNLWYEFYLHDYGNGIGFVVAMQANNPNGYNYILLSLNGSKINWDNVIIRDGIFSIPNEIKKLAERYYKLLVFL